MLFSDENDYLELLLPKILLKGETVLTRLLEIPEEAFLQDVEIIGWMYQFYISVKKDEVFASKKTITKDTLPAVTQLFTPDWIVRYMAENSIGRIWIESYPNSSLKSDMKYYVADPEQTQEIKRKIDAVKYQNVRPEDIHVWKLHDERILNIRKMSNEEYRERTENHAIYMQEGYIRFRGHESKNER